MGEIKYYSAEGLQKLKDELNYLITKERPAASAAIAEARDKGDLSENAEYDAARNEQSQNEARINELEELIRNASVIDESTLDTTVVNLGSIVLVENVANGRKIEYTLVGSNQVDPASYKISDSSPVGAGLVGKREGDVVQIEIPRGTVTYKILEITRHR